MLSKRKRGRKKNETVGLYKYNNTNTRQNSKYNTRSNRIFKVNAKKLEIKSENAKIILKAILSKK